MSKKNILKTIESVLAKYAKEQTNLVSESARKQIAAEILEQLSGKYYMTAFNTYDLKE